MRHPPHGSTEGPAAPRARAGVSAGPRVDVCLSGQVRAGCALQINSRFYTYSFRLCTQPACQWPGGLAGRCLSPALPSVWVLQMVFIQSCSDEGGHGKCDAGSPLLTPSFPGCRGWLGHLHPADPRGARGHHLPLSPGPGRRWDPCVCLLLGCLKQLGL